MSWDVFMVSGFCCALHNSWTAVSAANRSERLRQPSIPNKLPTGLSSGITWGEGTSDIWIITVPMCILQREFQNLANLIFDKFWISEDMLFLCWSQIRAKWNSKPFGSCNGLDGNWTWQDCRYRCFFDDKYQSCVPNNNITKDCNSSALQLQNKKRF